MNEEVKRSITELTKEYSLLFLVDENSLTFTNQVKHTIKKDEIPV